MRRCHLRKLVVRLVRTCECVRSPCLIFAWTEYNRLKIEDEIDLNAHYGAPECLLKAS